MARLGLRARCSIIRKNIQGELNFFRIHLLVFTFTPLILSTILFAANSPTPNAPPISYIDSLFCCVSAMTVTGLATVDLSTLTGFQQALLFVQCCLGSPVAVSWVMVYIRRKYFAKKFEHLMSTSLKQTAANVAENGTLEPSSRAGREHDQNVKSGPNSPVLSRTPTEGTTRSTHAGWVISKVFARRSHAHSPSRGRSRVLPREADELSTVDESDDHEHEPRSSHATSRTTTRSRTSSIVSHGRKHDSGGSSSGKSNGGALGRFGIGRGKGVSKGLRLHRLRPDMIRRMDDAPMKVDPSGWVTEENAMEAAAGINSATATTSGGTAMADNNIADRTTSPEDLGAANEAPDSRLPAVVLEEGVDAAPAQHQSDSETDNSRRAAPPPQPPANSPRLTRTITLQSHISDDSHSPHYALLQAPQLSPLQHPGGIGGRQLGVPLGHTMTVEFVEPERPRGRNFAQDGIREDADGRDERDHALRRGRSVSNVARRRLSVTSSGNGPADSNEAVWDDRRSTIGPNTHYLRPRRTATMQSTRSFRASTIPSRDYHYQPSSSLGTGGGPGARTLSIQQYPTHASMRPASPVRDRALHRNYGGFPGPQALLAKLIGWIAPGLRRRFVRTVTLPRTTTLQSHVPTSVGGGVSLTRAKSVPYLSFDAIVGRNSTFHLLTESELEELGGVEYRALNALLWIVGAYHILVQAFALVIVWPYIALPRWRSSFEMPQLHRFVPPGWFSAFQVVSAYTNTGMSLVDQSMVPFQRAYPMILAMIFLILAGNTAFPIFLRLTIWTITKCVPMRSRINETLHFLLDHPRRCFVYLFPSHQTWFLLTVLVAMAMTDWFFFLVLDIGNPTIDAIPLGVRFFIGLLQAMAVRAAGFGVVALSALAPAVQVLYVMMMYISVYPIAMSVRSTNVYEERSLGVFDESDEEDEDDDEPSGHGPRVAVWGRYLTWHARKQLAFDMWWLILALFLVCIIERSRIQDEVNLSYFTIFNIIFELVSAYGTVGLSLGVPYASFSFSGAFTPLSKLIVCAVMIRGRHRGLPNAIDRAVILPIEFKLRPMGGANASATGMQDATASGDNVAEDQSGPGTRADKKVANGNGHANGILHGWVHEEPASGEVDVPEFALDDDDEDNGSSATNAASETGSDLHVGKGDVSNEDVARGSDDTTGVGDGTLGNEINGKWLDGGSESLADNEKGRTT